MSQHLLVAVDGSELCKKAMRRAAYLAACDPDTKVTLVHAVAPVSAYVYGAYNPQLVDDVKSLGEELLQEMKAYAESIGLNVETVLLYGHAAWKITDYAKENGVDLLLIGSRGLSGMKELFLGSVSHGVVQASAVPVLIEK